MDATVEISGKMNGTLASSLPFFSVTKSRNTSEIPPATFFSGHLTPKNDLTSIFLDHPVDEYSEYNS